MKYQWALTGTIKAQRDWLPGCRVSLICLSESLMKGDCRIQPRLKFLSSDCLKNSGSRNIGQKRKKVGLHGADRWRKNTEVFYETKQPIHGEKLSERPGIR